MQSDLRGQAFRYQEKLDKQRSRGVTTGETPPQLHVHIRVVPGSEHTAAKMLVESGATLVRYSLAEDQPANSGFSLQWNGSGQSGTHEGFRRRYGRYPYLKSGMYPLRVSRDIPWSRFIGSRPQALAPRKQGYTDVSPTSAPRCLLAPHKWAVGTTFEWNSISQVHPNSAYDHEPEPKRKNKKPAEPDAARTPARTASKPAAATAKPKAPEKPQRIRLTPEERRERDRARAAENRRKLKVSGICKDCHQPAYPGKRVVPRALRIIACHDDPDNRKATYRNT